MTTIPPRSEIAPEHTWNAPSLFPSVEAWRAAYKQLEASIPEIDRFKGHLEDSPATLADALELVDRRTEAIGKLFTYTTMASSVDTTDQVAAGLDSQVNGLYGRLRASSAFVDPEILAIGRAKLDQWIAQEPRLAVFAHYIDNLYRLQAHVRSAEVEETLGLAADPFSAVRTTATLLTNADMKFQPATASTGEEFPVVQGNLGPLLLNPDREVRRTAWEHYSDGHLAFKNTLASNLAAAVKQDVFIARVRRYQSALEASLFPNNIPVETFYNLVETFRRHLPTWHRYWAIRKRALGYDTLHTYDVWTPLTDSAPQVPYSQAVEWICQGLRPLGEEYVNTLRRGCLQDRWVDVYPNQGKRAGAFSSGSIGTHPFIMMSYSDTVKAASTLAHELGHSMHSYFTWQNQPPVYSEYSLFVAEVASNFNQAMVRAHLLKNNPDPRFQIAVIEEAMDNFHRYFFIMPTLARFELELHERTERGQAVTADNMIKLMADLFAEGYGTEATVDGQRDGITWATFGHLYANFYVFQYATGISGAHALSQRILSGEPGAAEDYLAFLRAGNSIYPLEALKRAGVELTTPEPVERTFDVLSGLIDRLEKLVGA